MARRVIALVSSSAVLPRTPAAVVVRAGSGYEAAAELLAEPAALLVVDLGRLGAAHVPLLQLASRMEVPVLAFGTVAGAIPADVARRLHLAGPGQLASAIDELLAEAPGDAAPEPSQPAPVGVRASPPAAAVADPPDRPPAKPSPLPARAARPDDRPSPEGPSAAAPPPARTVPRKRAASGKRRGGAQLKDAPIRLAEDP